MKNCVAVLVLLSVLLVLAACGGGSSTTTTNPASQQVAPSITTQPANQTVTAGQTATFSVVASGSTQLNSQFSTALNYQWRRNNVDISGATAATYTTPATTTADSGASFSVVVSNSAGSVTSNSATLTVNPATVRVTGVTLPSTAFVAVNVTTTIRATVTPGNATNKTLSWNSSDPTVATVNASGVITGVKVGTTTITARSTDGSNLTSNACTVTVTALSTYVTEINLPLTQLVYVGSTATLSASVLPTTATNTTVTWTSSDPNVATVNSSGVVTGVKVGSVQITATSTDGTNVTSNFCTLSVTFSPTSSGWTDFKPGLVVSDGTHSLGDNTAMFNSTRDKGSKIVYFDVSAGNNDTAEVYWWNGTNIVDSNGRTANGGGQTYGTDPLNPNLAAIKAFKQAIGVAGNTIGDPRLRSHMYNNPSGGYADWFLFRRGQVHDTFDSNLNGGNGESHPVVVAGYGPLADGRAVIDPIEGQTVSYKGSNRQTVNPFSINTGEPRVWFNMVISGLELRAWWYSAGFQDADSLGGGPTTLFIEDCAWLQHTKPLGATLLYLPKKTTLHRSIIAFAGWSNDGSHSLGYYTHGQNAQVTFDDVIFYRGGFQSDPLTTPDPKRDIYSRNIYEGGGAFMGHTYRNFISADGGSGGPQMRYGGLIENSLIIEGYWYSSTQANDEGAEWMTAANQQSGNPSAIVQNNVQLIFAFPAVKDPDPLKISDSRSQPGWGYHAQSATFNAQITGNIISNAMLLDDLGNSSSDGNYGVMFSPSSLQYPDGNTYTMLNSSIRNNIFYRTNPGLRLENNWNGVVGNIVEGNVFAVGSVIGASPTQGTTIDFGSATNLSAATQLAVRNNRFYSGTGATLPSAPWMGSGNTLAASSTAAATEHWPDPNRTLKRYVKEVLGLTLLDWADDPYLTSTDPITEYDPTGMKTFMAVATHMRRGGATAIPTTGKPSWTADYPWDERFTAQAVVNWIRAGFGWAAVQ